MKFYKELENVFYEQGRYYSKTFWIFGLALDESTFKELFKPWNKRGFVNSEIKEIVFTDLYPKEKLLDYALALSEKFERSKLLIQNQELAKSLRKIIPGRVSLLTPAEYFKRKAVDLKDESPN